LVVPKPDPPCVLASCRSIRIVRLRDSARSTVRPRHSPSLSPVDEPNAGSR
jgi:hypothetical protein